MHATLKAEIASELDQAMQARQAGNEGRARVCARRAAGLAARDYLARRGLGSGGSAYDLLQRLAGLPGLTPDLQAAASRLTMRVSEAFALPADVDLIAEARHLIGGLE
jgi:hypothetical protein